MNYVQQIKLIPLIIGSWAYGKSIHPMLAEITGLSLSHMRPGKKLNLSLSTQDKIKKFGRKWLHEKRATKGWSSDETSNWERLIPSSLANESRNFSDFIHGLEIHGSPHMLPLTLVFAGKVDELLNGLEESIERNDFESFKQEIIECSLGYAIPTSTEIQQDNEVKRDAVNAEKNFEEIMIALKYFFENLILSLLAALDVEHGSSYFKLMKPRALFLLVAPTINSKVDIDYVDFKFGRNIFNLPVRRLLELSHALMFRVTHTQWPNKPAGRKMLGDAIGLPDYVVGKLFDGTRKMDAVFFYTIWERMCKSVGKRDPFYAPVPLLIVTIFLQNGLISWLPNKKINSVIILDKNTYTDFFSWHRQQWSGKLNQGTLDWPSWLED
jgi:hypothetical protein